MDKKTLFELVAFAKHMSLMNEPIEKVLALFNDPYRLHECPAEIIIKL